MKKISILLISLFISSAMYAAPTRYENVERVRLPGDAPSIVLPREEAEGIIRGIALLFQRPMLVIFEYREDGRTWPCMPTGGPQAFGRLLDGKLSDPAVRFLLKKSGLADGYSVENIRAIRAIWGRCFTEDGIYEHKLEAVTPEPVRHEPEDNDCPCCTIQ